MFGWQIHQVISIGKVNQDIQKLFVISENSKKYRIKYEQIGVVVENWILFSFLSALTFAVVNTIDKYKVFDSINLSHPVFCIYVGISNLILGSFFIIIFPIQNATSSNILLAIFTGILQGISIGLMFKALSQEEVTRVVPIYQTYPIYVLIIALLFLDERLTLLQILSIILMFTGGILASIEINKKIN